jgi:hypothetical protein
MSERGQALIEFSFTVGLLMLLVVATAQVAIFLNYRSSLGARRIQIDCFSW